MKKVLRNSVFVLAAALAMIQFGDNSITKDTHFIEEASSNQSVGAQSVKKLIGSDETIEYSKIYTQYAELENNYVLRFAVAVKGNVNSLTFTRASLEGHAEKVKPVPTVYRGIIADKNTYYYDGAKPTTDESKAGNYYWACYTISYGKSSTLKDTPIDLNLSINGESKVSIQKSLQYVMNYVAVEDITLNNINLYNNELVFDLSKGATSQSLDATVLPEKATEADNITYEIKNKEIATVDNEGNITPVSVGKTTLTIKCDEVTKVVTIRVVKLYDSSLITDTKETLSNISNPFKTPGWYASNANKDYIKVSLNTGTISINAAKSLSNSKNPLLQIRYQPSNSENTSVYTGKYLMAFTINNQTNGDVTLKCNLNGKTNTNDMTQNLVISSNETQNYLFVFRPTEVSQYLNIKLMKIGTGTLTLDNIHFIALAD